MALMELIVIARCAEAKGSANLLKQLAITTFKHNGIIIIERKCERSKSIRRQNFV